jgi:large subunit ribosomal protein L25
MPLISMRKKYTPIRIRESALPKPWAKNVFAIFLQICYTESVRMIRSVRDLRMASSLRISKRCASGSRKSRKLRRDGLVPGVVYGCGGKPVLVEVGEKELSVECEAATFFGHVIEAELGAGIERFIPKDVDFHPVSGAPTHVDFQRVSRDSKIKVHVPVEFENEDRSPGLKKGGMINIVVHRLECNCSPYSIPERIVLDLSRKEIGDSFALIDVRLPDGVSPVNPERDSVIATIVNARASDGENSSQEAGE